MTIHAYSKSGGTFLKKETLVVYVLTAWAAFTAAWNLFFAALVLGESWSGFAPQPSTALIVYGFFAGVVAVGFLWFLDGRWFPPRAAAVCAPVLFALAAVASLPLWFYRLFPGSLIYPTAINPLAWVGLPMFAALHIFLVWGTWKRRPWAWTTLVAFPGLHPAGFIGIILVKLMTAMTIDEDSFWLSGIIVSEVFALALLPLVFREFGVRKDRVPSSAA